MRYANLTEQQKQNRRDASKKWRDNNHELYSQRRKIIYERDKETIKTNNRNRKHTNTARWLLWIATARAKKKGLECTIKESDIVVPDKCPILGIPIQPTDGAVSGSSPSLDRKNPEKGYIPGNVFVISHKANNLKRNMTIDQLKVLLSYMES